MKRTAILCIILIIALLSGLCACGGIEYAVVSSGNLSAEGLYYDLYENGTAAITGRSGNDAELIIPKTVDGHRVVSIAPRAFEAESGIVSLKIRAELNSIGEFAFSEIESLMLADISGTPEVGTCAFYGCVNLTRVSGTGKLKRIGDMGFCGCISLVGFDFPDKLEAIGERAFGQCSSLAFIKLPKSLKTVGAGVFEGCESLAGADITGLKNVPACTFTRCVSLSAVYFSPSLASVGEQAFRGCESLQTLNLPKSLSAISDSAFFGCTTLSTVNYSGSEKQWNAITVEDGNYPLEAVRPYCGIKLSGAPSYAAAKTSVFSIPEDGTASGEDSGFEYALLSDGTVEITGYTGASTAPVIPAKIGGNEVVSVGAGAFVDNTRIVSVDLGKVKAVKSTAFAGCSSLKTVKASDRLESVGINAFTSTPFLEDGASKEFFTLGSVLVAYNGSSTAVTLPSGIRHIGGGAFAMNSSVVFCDLGSETVSLDEQAFSFCESLRYVNAPSLCYVGPFAFCGCTELTLFDISERVGFIGECAFADCYRLKYVCLGQAIGELSGEVFANCQNIRLVRIPASVKRIYSSSFSGCMTFVVQYPGTREELSAATVNDGVFFLDDMFFVSE